MNPKKDQNRTYSCIFPGYLNVHKIELPNCPMSPRWTGCFADLYKILVPGPLPQMQ